LAANSNSNNISILYGEGSGVFANSLVNPTATTITGNTRPLDTQLFDLNGDRYLDLVTTDYNRDRVSVWLGTEDGSFSSETHYQVGDGAYSVAIEDLDGDDNVDLVTTDYNRDRVSVWLGKSDGSFICWLLSL
jgi:hypothetical protein